MHFCMLMFKLKVKFFLVNSYLTLCQNKFSQWHFWSTERKHGTKNYFNIKGKTYIYILIFILSVYRLPLVSMIKIHHLVLSVDCHVLWNRTFSLLLMFFEQKRIGVVVQGLDPPKNYEIRQMNCTPQEKMLWFGQFVKLMFSSSK